MWILILVATVGALIYNLEHIMRKFLVYDVEASVNIIRSTQQVRVLTRYFQPRHYVICEFMTLQRFPAVTICNMSPFKASLVAKNEEISRILNSQHSNVRKRRAAAEPPLDSLQRRLRDRRARRLVRRRLTGLSFAAVRPTCRGSPPPRRSLPARPASCGRRFRAPRRSGRPGPCSRRW